MKPAIALSASTSEVLASSSIDCKRLCAITGSITFSSKLPICAPMATDASLPMTCAQTIMVASGMTGLILPGMIDEPGCSGGSTISAKPACGPLFIKRKSLAIFINPTA